MPARMTAFAAGQPRLALTAFVFRQGPDFVLRPGCVAEVKTRCRS